MKRKFKVGQKLTWRVKEFDGVSETKVVVTEVFSDHVIAKSEDDMTLWIDEDNECDFYNRE